MNDSFCVIVCSNHCHASIESQTCSDVAKPSSVNNSTSSTQKTASRQCSASSRKSSSAKSDTTNGSRNSVLQKFAPSTYRHVFQQKSLKASMNVLVYTYLSLTYYASVSYRWWRHYVFGLSVRCLHFCLSVCLSMSLHDVLSL